MAVQLRALGNSSLTSVPPNLTNPSCVGTASDLSPAPFNPYGGGQTFLGTNISSPLPFESKVTANEVAAWCPSNLEVSPLNKPSNGVYNYPDGNVQRPAFDPCFSACAKNHAPQDCCTGGYDSPSACQPSSYSKSAKSVCPDAYSYAFDDQTSTFIIPAGAGFEVIFCPGGRSTNILATEKTQLTELSQTGHVKRDEYEANMLNLPAPNLNTIPLARIANLTEQDHRRYKATLLGVSHQYSTSPPDDASRVQNDGDRYKAAVVKQAAAQASIANMWSLRHRWNGSGSLLGPDLTGRAKHHITKTKRKLTPVMVNLRSRSDAGRQAHFARHERVRSGFCLYLGMLAGAIGAWAVV